MKKQIDKIALKTDKIVCQTQNPVGGMMCKISILVLLALLAAPLLNASAAAPGPGPKMVTVCYYGVTLTVSEKIAARYVKIGATYGPCGEDAECPPGTIAWETENGIECLDISFMTSTIEKPADSQKAIQLDQPTDATFKALLSLGTGKLTTK